MQTLECKHCKKQFEETRKGKVYCTRSCKQNACAGRTGRYRRKGKLYKKYLKDKCEFCSFVPVHPCQLDVDHIDGNHKNNAPENLQTLCANCHRLKTYQNKDWQ